MRAVAPRQRGARQKGARPKGTGTRGRLLAVLVALLGVFVWLNMRPVPLSGVSVQPQLRVVVEPERVLFYPSDAGAALPAGLPLRLILSTPAGPVVWTGQSSGDLIPINLAFVRAGQTPYSFTAGEATVEGSFTKQPGPPVGILQLKVGRRMARVTADSPPALIVHPLDAQENVTNELVYMRAEGPGGDVWQRSRAPQNLLAWSLLPAGGDTGTLKVSAVSGGVRGERAEVDLLSGVATSLSLRADAATAPATGRDPWRLTLTDALDAKGNPVNDGTTVNFIGGNRSLDFFLTRPLIQGGQPLVLPTYPQVGRYNVQAHSGAYSSSPVILNAAALNTEGVLNRWASADPLQLSVGPVVSPSGAFADDGTPVTLRIVGNGAALLETTRALENGVLLWQLPPLPAGARALESCVVGVCELLELPLKPLEVLELELLSGRVSP